MNPTDSDLLTMPYSASSAISFALPPPPWNANSTGTASRPL